MISQLDVHFPRGAPGGRWGAPVTVLGKGELGRRVGEDARRRLAEHGEKLEAAIALRELEKSRATRRRQLGGGGQHLVRIFQEVVADPGKRV